MSFNFNNKNKSSIATTCPLNRKVNKLAAKNYKEICEMIPKYPHLINRLKEVPYKYVEENYPEICKYYESA